MITPVREAQKVYCSRAMYFAIGIGFFLYLMGFTGLMKGLILGTFFSIFNFILMGETLPHRLNKSEKGMFLAVFGSVTLRFILLAVPMVLALKNEHYNLYATAVGVFMIQILILLDPIGGKLKQLLKIK